MPETLTESFCERCGTRYTFEAAIPTGRGLGRLKVLTKGLANFVMSDDTSLDEALADARSDRQRQMTSHQLDAFHQTFQFCMSCRQYTCANCWNEPEGQCLSCAPQVGQEILEAPFPHPGPTAGLAQVDATAGADTGNGHAPHPSIEASAWPTADLPVKPEASELAVEAPAAGVEPEPEIEIEVVVAESAVAEPVVAESVFTAPAADPVVVEPAVEPPPVSTDAAAEVTAAAAASPAAPPILETPPASEAVATGRTADLFARFRPDRRTPARAAEPEITGGLEQPPTSTPEEPAAVEPAAVEPAAVEPAAPRRDRIDAPAWSIVAPEVLEPSAPGPDLPSVPPTVLATQPTPAARPIHPSAAVEPTRPPAPPPSWPTHVDAPPPQWPMPPANAAPQWPSRPAVPPPVPPAADLWAASSQEVLNRPGSGVQACVSCGLPLSATARFCRRCGSQQH